MSTLTSRLGLVMPAPADSMAAGDNNLLANYGKIDTAMGCQISAGVAPAAPFTGQLWDNTTSGERNVYDGIANKPFYADAWQKGKSAYINFASQQSTDTELQLINQFVPVVNAAKYLVRWSAFMKWDSGFLPINANIFILKFKLDGTLIKTKALPSYGGRLVTTGCTFQGFFEFTSALTGQSVLAVLLNAQSSGGFTALINPSASSLNVTVERWAN